MLEIETLYRKIYLKYAVIIRFITIIPESDWSVRYGSNYSYTKIPYFELSLQFSYNFKDHSVLQLVLLNLQTGHIHYKTNGISSKSGIIPEGHGTSNIVLSTFQHHSQGSSKNVRYVYGNMTLRV